MKKILLGLLVVSNMLFGGIIHQKIDYSVLDKMPKKELAQKLTKKMVENSNLPLKIDKITELINIYTYKDNIIMLKTLDDSNYDFKKIWNNKKIQQNFIKKMLFFDSQALCNNEVWSYLINKRDIIPEINYSNKKGKSLFKYTIEPTDCEKIK